jgi:pterin-4a-carbinolamine dehydratase
MTANASIPMSASTRNRGDFGFNHYHNSNPEHGGAYGRHERAMNDGEIEDFLKSVKGWSHDPDTHAIWRSFYFETFDEAYRFMGRLYAFCYGSDKYPHVTWDQTRIDVQLYSPSFKGLSKREARVAAFLNDQLNMLKKAKLQRSKLVEVAKRTTVHHFIQTDDEFDADPEAPPATPFSASPSQLQPRVPEAFREPKSWKDLM